MSLWRLSSSKKFTKINIRGVVCSFCKSWNLNLRSTTVGRYVADYASDRYREEREVPNIECSSMSRSFQRYDSLSSLVC